MMYRLTYNEAGNLNARLQHACQVNVCLNLICNRQQLTCRQSSILRSSLDTTHSLVCVVSRLDQTVMMLRCIAPRDLC